MHIVVAALHLRRSSRSIGGAVWWCMLPAVMLCAIGRAWITRTRDVPLQAVRSAPPRSTVQTEDPASN
jgi:hypothetical protein